MSIQWSVIIGHSIVRMVVEHGAFIAFNSLSFSRLFGHSVIQWSDIVGHSDNTNLIEREDLQSKML